MFNQDTYHLLSSLFYQTKLQIKLAIHRTEEKVAAGVNESSYDVWLTRNFFELLGLAKRNISQLKVLTTY